jgi:uncharacterized GH25 family protein
VHRYFVLTFALLSCLSVAQAHDTWVQTNTSLVRPADTLHVDLILGNHGNEHRDFKMASKLASLDGGTLDVMAPDGTKTDLREQLVDLGLDPKEGFHSAKFQPKQTGVYTIAHTLDKLHKTTRSVKSAKSYFGVAESLDKPRDITAAAFAKPLGHPLELVLESHPLIGMKPGAEIKVKVLHNGKLSVGTKVSFIPRGVQLAEGFDPEYERKADGQGRVTFSPKEAGYLLIVAHRSAPEEKGTDFDGTKYSATIVLHVPSREIANE